MGSKDGQLKDLQGVLSSRVPAKGSSLYGNLIDGDSLISVGV